MQANLQVKASVEFSSGTRSYFRAAHRLQAWYHRLVRRFGGPKNLAAVKKAIVAIAHTLLKIVYKVLKSGKLYQDPGADF